MPTPLRSLSGLLDFECAARWNSFRLAALELHKTPAAVSQQVKQLEQTLGFALFARHPRHITLTEKGQELAATATRLLQELQAKVGALQEGDEERVLRVTTTHSFAMKWLVPRLHRFTRQHPALDLRIESSDQVVPLDTGRCDVALRYSRLTETEPADLLWREQYVVAYSPELLAAEAAPELTTLLRQPLLYEGTPELWLRLLAANDAPRQHLDFARSYSHAGLLVQAAAAGQGVALVPYSLACEDLAQGRLRLARCRPLPADYGYRLLCPAEKRHLLKISHCEAWLRAELGEMRRAFEEAFQEEP